MTQPVASRSAFRIVIVEDHVLFAESLELALTVEGYDVRRVTIPDKEQAPGALIATITRRRPRVVLLDLDLGRFGEGERLIAPLAKAGINVVVVTASVDRARWGDAVRCGARKVLSKSRPLNDILATVRRINQGLQVMTREEREELLREWAVRPRRTWSELQARLELLTVREREVLAHLMKGRTVREIATDGVVAEATVRTQVKSILAKLEVTLAAGRRGPGAPGGLAPAPARELTRSRPRAPDVSGHRGPLLVVRDHRVCHRFAPRLPHRRRRRPRPVQRRARAHPRDRGLRRPLGARCPTRGWPCRSCSPGSWGRSRAWSSSTSTSARRGTGSSSSRRWRLRGSTSSCSPPPSTGAAGARRSGRVPARC